MDDIDGNTVLKMSKHVIKRYEHNLKNGTMILCNMKTKEFWFGNEFSRYLLQEIDGEKNIQIIYSNFLTECETSCHEEIIDACNVILEDLIKKGFVEIKQ